MKAFLILLVIVILLQSTSSPQWYKIPTPHKLPNVINCFYHHQGYLFSITSDSILFRSLSNGSEWDSIYTFHGYSPGRNIRVTGDGDIYAPTLYGYLKSTDLGMSWERKQLFSTGAGDIMIDSSGHIYICQNTHYSETNYIWKSTDHGNTWIKKENGLNGDPLVSLKRDGADKLYTLTERGFLYTSTDYGETWDSLKEFQKGLALDIDGDNNIYVLAEVLYKSSNSGLNWGISLQMEYISNLFVDELDNIFVENKVDNCFKYSSDAGNSWLTINSYDGKLNRVFASNGITYACTTWGLLFGNDLNTWQLAYRYFHGYVAANDFLMVDKTMFLATDEGLYISTNGGNDWDTTSVKGMPNMIKNDPSNNIFVSSTDLFRSTDLGVSWIKCFDPPLYIGGFSINDSGYIAVLSRNGAINESALTNIYRSMDTGSNWAWIAEIIGNFTSVGITYFAKLSNDGTVYFSSYFFSSAPGGAWSSYLLNKVSIYGGSWSILRNNDLFCLGMDIYDDSLYVASGAYDYGAQALKGIYVSGDNGLNFYPLNNGITGKNMSYVLKTGPNTIVSKSYDGILFYSINDGVKWHQFDLTGLTGAVTKMISCQGELYLTTYDGLYKFTGVMTSQEDNNSIIKITDFNLSQNYPNPFNPTTEIEYSIPVEGKVSLELFDILGNKISSLVNEYKTAGNYSYLFNGNNISTGVYFYRLRINNFTAAKKMLLLK